jgi:hypothetical protein
MSSPTAPEGAASRQVVPADRVSPALPDGGWFLRLVTLARRNPGLGSHLTIAALLIVILCICIRTGIVPMRSYVEDIICFADNAWRVLWGQRPHVDYSSGLGPVTYLIAALGMKLAGGNLNGLGYANTIAGIAIGIWAYVLLVRRVSGLLAAAGAAMLCLLALAPVQLGESFRLSTIAMSYNRHGYALLGLLIIESFPLRQGEPARGVGGALSTGALCAILLFLKANYFLVALVLAAVSLIWSGRLEWRRMAGMASGFAVVATAFLAYLRFDVGAMLADLRMAADARSGAVSPAFVVQVFAENAPGFLILAGLAAMTQAVRLPPADGGWVGRVLGFRPLALAGIVYVAGVLLLVTNSQLERLPMHELLALLFLDCILQCLWLDVRHAAAMAAIGIGLILGTQSADPLALLNGLRLKLHSPMEFAYPVTSGGYAGAVFMDDYQENRGTHRAFGNFLALYLKDGLDLLRREIKPGEKVTTMDTYNPFPFALGIEPPHGGMQSATYQYFFSDRIHLSADAFFGNADIVMYPKEHALRDAAWRGLEIYYIPEMERRFVQVAESAQWRMYRRRK